MLHLEYERKLYFAAIVKGKIFACKTPILSCSRLCKKITDIYKDKKFDNIVIVDEGLQFIYFEGYHLHVFDGGLIYVFYNGDNMPDVFQLSINKLEYTDIITCVNTNPEDYNYIEDDEIETIINKIVKL